MPEIKLVAFDLDGVLADGGGSWLSVHDALGTRDQAHENAMKYFNGEIDFKQWARVDIKLWDGVSLNEIKKILYDVPLMNGAKETLRELKNKYLVGIISGGLSPLAEKIALEHNLDFAYGNKILEKDGRVIGIDNRVDFEGKGVILSKVCEKHSIKLSESAAVGDYLNDIPMFKQAGFSIAFNPQHPSVCENADVVVREKDLRRILKHF